MLEFFESFCSSSISLDAHEVDHRFSNRRSLENRTNLPRDDMIVVLSLSV